MGLLGLRKFIDAAGITRQLPVPHDEEPHNEDEDEKEDGPTSSTRATMVDHVLVDMNCIIHSCFGRTDVENKPKRDVIAAILDRLRILLTQVVIPRRSLTVCLDGPAPIAKLHTQRLRRRKASLMDCGANTQQQLNSLAITAGSLFLVELENALAAQFKLREGRGFLNRCCPVYLYGSTVMGEGEAKISRALAYLASGAEHGGPSSTWGSSSSSRAPPSYNPNDSVTILGNDIDLVLTGIAATHYQRITIIGPSSLQLINVSDILYRWMRASSTSGGDGAQPLTIQQLSSVRIDFIFLFLLNGGDHYVGAGEVAMGLWRRYRSVRAAYPDSTLINANLDTIDVDFLADVLQASEYTGECDAQVGMELLQAALWSLYTVVSGCCPDYFFIPPTSSPHLSHLRAAAAHCQKTRKRIQFSAKTQDTVPLTPLEAYVALMPTEASLPRGVASALQQRKHHITAHTLQTSNDVSVIATAAKAAVAASAEFLTPSERFLRSFTAPVRLNVVPPRKRLSRHEQHYMMKKHGRIIVEEPIPVVERIDDSNTPTMSYAHVDYPSSVEELSFLTPFDAAPQQGSGGKRRGGAAGSSTSLRSISIHNTSANEEHNSAATKMERTLAEVVESGSRLPEKRVRAMKRRLHRLQSINMKELRGEADDLNLMDRGDGAQLHEELAQFLGSEHDARHILQESKREAMHDSQKKKKLLMKRAEKDEVKGTRQDQSAKKASTPTTKQRLAGGNKKKLTTPAVASSSSSSSLLNNHKTKQTKKKSRKGG